MSLGSTVAVEDAQEDYREECADWIAQKAAELVAARDMGRAEAIETAAELLRQENDADADVTGVAAVEIDQVEPSRKALPAQVAAIKADLMDAAREAAAGF